MQLDGTASWVVGKAKEDLAIGLWETLWWKAGGGCG